MNDDRHIRQTKPRIFRHIGSAVIFSVFANILLLTGPIFMLQVYDRVLPSGSRETLVVLMVLVAGLYGLMALLDFARGRLFAAIGYRLQAELDGPVLSRRLAGRAADAPALGDLDILRTIWGAPAMAALADLPWTPIFILALYLFHPALGALALAGTLLVVLLWIGTHVLTRRLARSAAAADCVALRLAAEAERNADLIRAQAMLADIELRIATSRNAGIADGARAGWRSGLFSSATKSVRLMLQSAMLGLGAWLVMAGALSPGAMVAASILLGRALQPVELLVAGWSGLDAARRAWARVAPVLRDVQAPAAGIELPEPEPRLAVENLTIWHPGAPRPALRQVSFELEPGQALGVIGPSGSGKSTLARSLCGLAQGRGDLRLGGTPIARIDAHMLGRIIGYAPQDAGLFTGTVAQNIARMAAAPDDQAVLKAAAKAGIHDFILSLPAGYDTPLAADGAPLSTGQRQRVALARAFYGAPRLLILDEPIAALDAEGAAALNTAIRGFKAARGAAVIMTHRPMAIAECDMLLLLENGRAIAFGPREAVLSQHIGNAARVRRGMKGAA